MSGYGGQLLFLPDLPYIAPDGIACITVCSSACSVCLTLHSLHPEVRH